MEKCNTIVDCFEALAERYCERIAVKTKNITLTYGGLNRLANLIAYQIRSSCPGDSETDGQTVAMVFEHGADMIAGIMGILKAGKTYVALDPTYPSGRLTYILGDSKARLIITNDRNLRLAEELSGQADYPIHIFNIDSIDVKAEAENLNIKINPEQAVYILYTSGSTGNPKGVVQSHKNIVHLTHCFFNSLQIASSDRMALFTSYSHAMSAVIIFSSLLSGAALYPYSLKAEGNMANMANWIMEEKITIYSSVPTAYRYFIETIAGREQVLSLRAVILGGEPIYKNDLELYKKYFSDTCNLVNLFGSSELIVIMINIMTKEIANSFKASIPIGCAVDGVDVLLLDENGEQAEENQVGELVYRSRYLTAGYWNMEEYNQKIFSRDSKDEDKRIFRSGDLGRLMPGGGIEYIGRKDFQVKINGNRVESGEIESKLLNLPNVREATVIAKKSSIGNSYLCAFLVSDGEIYPSELRQYLEKELPDYMVPSYFIQLEKMPLTENGKLNRRELERINTDGSSTKEEEPTVDAIEAMLMETWKKILCLDKVGVNKSFFNMGGNSILAIQFEVEMERKGIDLQSSDLYQYKTIRELANYMKANKAVI